MIFFQLPSTLLPQLRDPKIYKAFQSTAVQLGKTCLLHSPKDHFCFTHLPFWTASLNSCSLYSQLLFLTLTPQGRRGSLMVLAEIRRVRGVEGLWSRGTVGTKATSVHFILVFPSALCPSQCQERKRNKSVSEAQTSSQGARLFFQGVLDKDGNHSVFPN